MPLVTYEEMNKAREVYNKARSEFRMTYFNFLISILREAGVYHKLVKIKDRNLVGQFQVAEDPYDRAPWTIKFYPLTQKGEVSLKSRYVSLNSWDESTLLDSVKRVVEEVVGDVPCE